ncbi:hypothetical protein SEA_SHAM_236 [Streptomyces phage Sham]|nr:hypothetical protein SEA_SHAM_236 [Streptomyces phage Sham]
MKPSDVTERQLKGWTYSITRCSKNFDVMFQHQYRAEITSPDGYRITNLLSFGNDIGIYAFTEKGAEKKVIKTIKRVIADEYNRAHPVTKSL